MAVALSPCESSQCDYCGEELHECEHTVFLQCPSCGKQRYHKDCVDQHLKKCNWKTETGSKTGLGGFPCPRGRGKIHRQELHPEQVAKVPCKCKIEMVTSIPLKSAKVEMKKAARIAAAMQQQQHPLHSHTVPSSKPLKPTKPCLNAQSTARFVTRPAAFVPAKPTNCHDALTSPLQQDVPGMEFVKPKQNDKAAKQRHQMELSDGGAELPANSRTKETGPPGMEEVALPRTSSRGDHTAGYWEGLQAAAAQRDDPMQAVLSITSALGVRVPLAPPGSSSRHLCLQLFLKALEDLAGQGYEGMDGLLQIVGEELTGEHAPSARDVFNNAEADQIVEAERLPHVSFGTSVAEAYEDGRQQHMDRQAAAGVSSPAWPGLAPAGMPVPMPVPIIPSAYSTASSHTGISRSGAPTLSGSAASIPPPPEDQQGDDSDVEELLALCLPISHKP